MKKLMSFVVIALLVGTLSGPALAQDATIASGNFAEPQILAEAVRLLIEQDTDLVINHVRNFQGSHLLHTAMMSNDVQMYVSWTGTQFTGPLGMEVTDEWKDRERVLEFVQQEFDSRYDAFWFDPFGFNNTYAIAVRRDFAEEHNLSTMSDLRPLAADMIIAMDITFREREGDGYHDMLAVYDIDRFQRVAAMDYGLMYRSVAQGDVDAAVAYSTDGRIPAMDLVILEDDLAFFPPYDASLVATNAFINAHPEIHDIIAPLIGAIDEATISYYNQLVDVDGMDYDTVAVKMLEDFGLLR